MPADRNKFAVLLWSRELVSKNSKSDIILTLKYILITALKASKIVFEHQALEPGDTLITLFRNETGHLLMRNLLFEQIKSYFENTLVRV